MNVIGPKENLSAAFDRCQDAFDRWVESKEELKLAQSAENKASCEYMNAKSNWEKVLKENAPGDLK